MSLSRRPRSLRLPQIRHPALLPPRRRPQPRRLLRLPPLLRQPRQPPLLLLRPRPRQLPQLHLPRHPYRIRTSPTFRLGCECKPATTSSLPDLSSRAARTNACSFAALVRRSPALASTTRSRIQLSNCTTATEASSPKTTTGQRTRTPRR